ncbi:hypothetical protein [Methanobrevibacter sp.]|uniref:hypothetical protein n=1 Tax=Methanobrevibacter sp. TaxID=66852 RepID=UPI00388D408E
MSKRVLVVNEEFSPSEEFIEEYVNTQDALPNLLTSILYESDLDIDTKRVNVYKEYPHLQELDEKESETTLKLLKENRKDEAEEYQIQLVLDFLKKYPQFKPLILGVESQTSSIFKLILDTIREAFVGDF